MRLEAFLRQRSSEDQIQRIAEKVTLMGASPEDVGKLVIEIIAPPPWIFFSTASERMEAMKAKRMALETLGNIAVSFGIRVPWK